MINEAQARAAYKKAKFFYVVGNDTGLIVKLTKMEFGRLLEKSLKSDHAILMTSDIDMSIGI